MINWVAVLRRILKLYTVKSQRELGMALGIPVAIGLEQDDPDPIPWRILELVVEEKKVSWDWLLTGREDGKTESEETAADAAATTTATVRQPPRIETRELERQLLSPQTTKRDEDDEYTKDACATFHSPL